MCLKKYFFALRRGPVKNGDGQPCFEQDYVNTKAPGSAKDDHQSGFEERSPVSDKGAGRHHTEQRGAHGQSVHNWDGGVQRNNLPKLSEGSDDAKEERDGGYDCGDGAGDDGYTNVANSLFDSPLTASSWVLKEETSSTIKKEIITEL